MVSHRETFLEEQRCSDPEIRKEKVMKLAFLLGSLRLSPSPGAHRAHGNGKRAAAVAQGDLVSFVLQAGRCVRVVVKHPPVLQLL